MGKKCVKSKILKHVTGRKYSSNLMKFGVSVEILIKQLKFAYSNVFQLVWLFADLNDAALFKLCLNSSFDIAFSLHNT